MQEIASLKFVGHADTEEAARRRLDANGGRWSLAIVGPFLAGAPALAG
ncbi:hypothetical protein [Polaromonas sp. JS666]|nr:hypothetical protein [Polaromonas sp. JS666]